MLSPKVKDAKTSCAKKMFIYSCLDVAVATVLIVLRDSFQEVDLVLGSFLLLICLVSIVELIKSGNLLSPYLPGILYNACIGLYSLGLDTSMTRMDSGPLILLVLCPAVWMIVCSLVLAPCKSTGNFIGSRADSKPSESAFRSLVILLFAVSALAMSIEWLHAGGIPVLRPDAETFRFSVSFNSYWHLVAISIKFVPLLAVAGCISFGSAWLKRDRAVLLAVAASLLMLIGTALRGELLCALATPMIALMLTKRIPMRFILIALVVAFLVLGAYPVIRKLELNGNGFMFDMMSISKYPDFWFLTPLYQTFSYNLHILNRVLDLFPSFHDFGFGQYTFLVNVPLADLGQSLASVQAEAWGVDFYGALVSTILGPWYADFGYFGWAAVMIIGPCLLSSSYRKTVGSQDGMRVAVYSYFMYNCLLMSYANPFDQVFVFYILVLKLVQIAARGPRKSPVNT